MPLIGTKLTLAKLLTDLSTRLDDSSNVRWSAAQKSLAIRTAMRSARGTWWEERLDDTYTYSDMCFRYDLPVNCERVLSVHFEPDDTGSPRYFVVPRVWYVEGTELVFKLAFPDYSGQTMHIRYLVYPNNLLTLTASNGVVSSTSLSSSTSTFITSGVEVGDEVEITGDSGGPYYVTVVSSETALTLHKAPTAGSSKTFYVARYTDLPYEYLIFGAMAELHEMIARNRPGIEVDEAVKWASYYRQMAQDKLAEQARHRATTRSY